MEKYPRPPQWEEPRILIPRRSLAAWKRKMVKKMHNDTAPAPVPMRTPDFRNTMSELAKRSTARMDRSSAVVNGRRRIPVKLGAKMAEKARTQRVLVPSW